jgi:hypothetical protein
MSEKSIRKGLARGSMAMVSSPSEEAAAANAELAEIVSLPHPPLHPPSHLSREQLHTTGRKMESHSLLILQTHSASGLVPGIGAPPLFPSNNRGG